MLNYYDDKIVPKYRKRKKKETPKKADHKHIYDELVLIKTILNHKEHYHSAYRCSICKKIGKENFFEWKEAEGITFKIMLSQEEILEKYKDIEIVEIK